MVSVLLLDTCTCCVCSFLTLPSYRSPKGLCLHRVSSSVSPMAEGTHGDLARVTEQDQMIGEDPWCWAAGAAGQQLTGQSLFLLSENPPAPFFSEFSFSKDSCCCQALCIYTSLHGRDFSTGHRHRMFQLAYTCYNQMFCKIVRFYCAMRDE